MSDSPEDGWVLSADSAALALRLARHRITVPLAKAAARFVEKKGWAEFGYARLDDHAREHFGFTGRSLRDLAAIGRGLDTKGPALARALMGDDGHSPLGRVAARLILRVSTKRSIGEWVRLARCVSVRRLRDIVRDARKRKFKWPPGRGRVCGLSNGTTDDPAPGADGLADVDDLVNVDDVDRQDDCDSTTSGHSPGHDDSSEAPSLRGEVSHDRCGDVASSKARAPGDLGNTGDMGNMRDPDDDPHREDHDDVRVRDQVSLTVPGPMLPAFDEGVELFRAVVGTQAPVASFVEAIVAEASTGAEPTDPESINAGVYLHRLQSGNRKADAEQRLARSTGNWEHLPTAPMKQAGEVAETILGSSLERLRDVSLLAGFGEAVALDKQIRTLLLLEEDLGRRLGRVLTDMAGRGAWSRLGFTDVEHYAEQRLDMSRSSARERVTVERGLRRLPIIREAYEEGIVSMQAALRVVRSIGRATLDDAGQHAWVDRAHRSTIKRLEDESRMIRRARGCDNMAGPHNAQPVPLDDATWHQSLRRSPGTARERLTRLARAGFLDGSADVFLRLRLEPDLARCFLATLEDRRSKLAAIAKAMPRDEDIIQENIIQTERSPSSPHAAPIRFHTFDSQGRYTVMVAAKESNGNGDEGLAASPAGLSLAAARMFSTRGLPVPVWVGLLSLLEEFIWTWDDPDGTPNRRSDAIYERDGWRCMAPGCTSRANLEDHHVIYRSQGGNDTPANRVCICRFHHRMGEHGDLSTLRGTAPLGLLWNLGRKRRWAIDGETTLPPTTRYKNEIRLN